MSEEQEIMPGEEPNQAPAPAPDPVPAPVPVQPEDGRRKFVLFDEAGEVAGAGFGLPPAGAIVMDVTEKVADLARLYVDGENGLSPRPEVPTPVLDGDSLSLPAGPVGTRLRVIDPVLDEIMWEAVTDESLTAHVLTLPDAGRYVVDIEPPFPWMPQQAEFIK